MFSALASSRKEPVEELLQAMIDAGVIAATDKPAILRIVPTVTEFKPAVKKAVNTQMLVNAVLPSFDEFQAVLDIRVGDEERGGFALPVAIAFLDTDSRDHRLWFQLTKKDVEGLIDQLNSLLKRFAEAEELIAKWPASAGGK
jgi:hypothetical protein